MASAAYEELTRGLNNADKRRLAQIVEERTVRLKIDKAVAEERLRAQLEERSQPRKRLQPPYDAWEDAVLLKQLPVAPGMRSAVARELAGKGDLSRRNATSIAARLAYHEVAAVSGGGLIAKTLDEAMERLETQRAALAGLADSISARARRRDL